MSTGKHLNDDRLVVTPFRYVKVVTLTSINQLIKRNRNEIGIKLN